jgi:hypothetical protein
MYVTKGQRYAAIEITITWDSLPNAVSISRLLHPSLPQDTNYKCLILPV